MNWQNSCTCGSLAAFISVLVPRAAALHRGAEALHHLDVRVDLAHAQGAALHVVLDARGAEAGQQARHQHDRAAHLFGQVVRVGIEARVAVVQLQRAGGVVHLHLAAELPEDVEDLADVGDLGDAHQAHRVARQQRRAQDGQHGVLVRAGHDAARERAAAVDDQMGHGGGGAEVRPALSPRRVRVPLPAAAAPAAAPCRWSSWAAPR
jgi:hypothetical protein